MGENTAITVSFLRKEFGANNFYGGNAPSREWTNQTLLAAEHRPATAGPWTFTVSASYRTHGDRFLFNQERPELSDNRHRTHAVLTSLVASRSAVGGAMTAGIEVGGDWFRSTNLGDHALSRISPFAEWRQPLGSRAQFDASLRLDRYSEFGASVNPSFGFGWWAAPAVRLRTSVGRAFRVPTFTERYYSDPANLARPDVGPEHAWAGEAGVDIFLDRGWRLDATLFGRNEDGVIDWLRPTVADRWRTYNVRDVRTAGIELGVRKEFPGGAFAEAHATLLDVEAADVDQLSKYVLDYAPRSVTAAAALPLPGRFQFAPRLEYRRRTRSSGTSDYVLLDARVGRPLRDRVELFVEGTNLFDVDYQEVGGVTMPGAAMTVGLAFGR
jgi:iron complex outermembrane receptor protein